MLGLNKEQTAAWASAVATAVAIFGSAAAAIDLSRREMLAAEFAEEDRRLVEIMKIVTIVGQCQGAINGARNLLEDTELMDDTVRLNRHQWQRMERQLDQSLLMLPDGHAVAISFSYLAFVDELIAHLGDRGAVLAAVYSPSEKGKITTLLDAIKSKQQELLNYIVEEYTGLDAVKKNRESRNFRVSRLRGFGDPK
jgi:hypothetical protein